MLREVQGGKEGSPSKKVAQRLSSSPHAPAPCSLAVRMLFECWVACQGSLMTCKENVAQRLWLASNTPCSLLSCSENVAQILRSSSQAPCLSHTVRMEMVAQRLCNSPQAPCSLQEYGWSGCCLHARERIPGPSTHFEVLPSSPPSGLSPALALPLPRMTVYAPDP